MIRSKACKRTWHDWHVSSHAFLACAVLLAYIYHVFELAVLSALVVVCSVAYHRRREKPGMIADVDRLMARTLFAYGVLQVFYAPRRSLLAFELCCAVLTVGIWVATRQWVHLNEFWHPVGLHVIPGVWASVVACTHASLVKLF